MEYLSRAPARPPHRTKEPDRWDPPIKPLTRGPSFFCRVRSCVYVSRVGMDWVIHIYIYLRTHEHTQRTSVCRCCCVYITPVLTSQFHIQTVYIWRAGVRGPSESGGRVGAQASTNARSRDIRLRPPSPISRALEVQPTQKKNSHHPRTRIEHPVL